MPSVGDEVTIIICGGSPVDIQFDTVTSGYAVYADGSNVILRVVPEPASLFLLTLGGFALIRRKRR